MKKPLNHRVFNVFFLPATNTLPVRLKIKDLRQRKEIVFSRKYDDTYDFDAHELAEHHLNKLGIEITGFGEAERGYVLFTRDFKTSIK